MTVHHHLDDATLVAYASGTLDQAFSVVVASHLAMCTQCREQVRMAEEVGGQLLEDAVSDTSDVSYDTVLSRIEGPGGASDTRRQMRTRLVAEKADVPLPLRAYLGERLDGVKWRTVAPGVRKYTIAKGRPGESQLYMLKINEGLSMPEHGHTGSEITLILKGSYRDDMGVFSAGDVADLDEHVEHKPTVEPGAPCICLVAAEAPTRFKGILARLIQPLAGI